MENNYTIHDDIIDTDNSADVYGNDNPFEKRADPKIEYPKNEDIAKDAAEDSAEEDAAAIDIAKDAAEEDDAEDTTGTYSSAEDTTAIDAAEDTAGTYSSAEDTEGTYSAAEDTKDTDSAEDSTEEDPLYIIKKMELLARASYLHQYGNIKSPIHQVMEINL